MTDRELAAAADTAFRNTTIPYPQWLKNVRTGKYPALGPPSQFGIGFQHLNEIMFPPVVHPTGLPAAPIPPFTPTRTIAAATPQQFTAAISNMQPGDLLKAGPMNVPGEIVLNRNVFPAARIECAPGFKLVGATPGSQLPSLYVTAPGWQLIGADITSQAWNGIRVDNVGFTSRRVYVHDCINTGVIVQGLSKAILDLDMEVEVTNCGTDWAIDPHAANGTAGSGLHGIYIGQTSYPVSGKVWANVHDQPSGAAIQAGGTKNLEVWLAADNITFQTYGPHYQTGGNALQTWNNNTGLTVHYLEANNVSQAFVNNATDTLSGIVEYGRCTNNRNTPPWPAYPGLTYGDVK